MFKTFFWRMLKVTCSLQLAACSLLVFVFVFIAQHSYSAEKTFEYNNRDKRDPFIPLIGEGVRLLIPQEIKSIEEITLEGIIFDQQQGSLVIINGEVFKQGELIAGFMLKEIKQDLIILTRDNKNYIVNLIMEE